MAEKNTRPRELGGLRDGDASNSALPEKDLQQLVKELQVQNDELQAKNRKLLKDQHCLKETIAHFIEIKDLAPVGIIEVRNDNIIHEANLTICRLLGVDKNALLQTRLTGWIDAKSRSKYYLHRKNVLASGDRQSCDILMLKPDGSNFHAMLQSVPQRLNADWMDITVTDISRYRRIEEELRQHRLQLEDLVDQRTQQLRALARQLVNVQERERSKIAGELHDEVGQLLTYAALLIDKAQRRPENVVLNEARSVIQNAVSQLRNLSISLSPPLLRHGGLVYALESLFEDYGRRTQIKVSFRHRLVHQALEDNVALSIYRIVQEALTNVARHAQSDKVEVHISQRGKKLCVEVKDDGIGFDPEAVKTSSGITGMKERAMALGGEVSIISEQNNGTRVTAKIPLT